MHFTGLLFPLALVLVMTCTTNFMIMAETCNDGQTVCENPLRCKSSNNGNVRCVKSCGQDADCTSTEYCVKSNTVNECVKKREKGFCNKANECLSNKCDGSKCTAPSASEQNSAGGGPRFPPILDKLLRGLQSVKSYLGGDY